MPRPIRSTQSAPATSGVLSRAELSRSDLAPEAASALTTQCYSKKPAIEGVKRHELKRFCEDGGSFSELLHVKGNEVTGFDGFNLAQVNYSDMEPGAIKAWHIHFRQEDLWFVPPICKLLVGLYDVRKDSPSRGVSQRFVMGDGRAQLLLIPRGVAHGVANLTGQRQILFYFVNSLFAAEEPDEHRLDPFVLGREFWEMAAG